MTKHVDGQNELTDLVKNIASNRDLKRVFLTGISFGGALASLYFISAAEQFLLSGIDVRCVTFGCPRFISTKDIAKLPACIKSRVLNIINNGCLLPFDLKVAIGSECSYGYVGSVLSQGNIEIPCPRRANSLC